MGQNSNHLEEVNAFLLGMKIPFEILWPLRQGIVLKMVRILCRHAVEKNSFLIAMVQSRILAASIFYLDTNLSNLEIRSIW